jgi:glutamate-ammonia-ligase adenylyltransferase
LIGRVPGLGRALAAAPDPPRAARLAETVLERAGAALDAAIAAHPEGVARTIASLCGVAPFLAPIAARDPDWIAALAADDLAAPLDADACGRALDAALAAGEQPERALRRAKYRALARIVVRDCALPLDRSGDTLADLTRLAELLLDRALRIAWDRTAARLGAAAWRDGDGRPRAARFCALGLGKLGGEELNFSSDVDLVYVYEHLEDVGSGPQERAPLDWFQELGRALQALVAAETEDRFLYRIDLDLRPEGPAGPMAISDAMLATYYETAADHWEKVAFMKARPVAGDRELGWRVVRQIHPMIYRAAMDTAGVARIRDWKTRVSREALRTSGLRGARGGGFDVKLDPGGIRDVEFVAQALQLLHGGRIPQLRDRSTQRALARLAEVKMLPADTAAALLDAYRFLRRLENRIQMQDERQLHELPRTPAGLARIARAMGFGGDDAVAAFGAALAARRRVVEDFDAAFSIETSGEAILALFERSQPRLLANPETRPLMEALAARFAREIEAAPDPALATNNLARFVESIGSRRFYYELLLDRPELVDRLVALFAGSRFLSALLAKHPRLIEPLFADPDILLFAPDALRADLAALRASLGPLDPPDFERDLEALRLFQHRQVLNIGLLDVDERIGRAECEGALTDVAEVTLAAALAVAEREVARVRPPSPAAAAARFAAIGMGKLASRELSYGSDLDLIFLYELDSPDPVDRMEAQEHCVRVAQRLISAIETPTANGSCYEIDSRLRPSGNQGALVTSLRGVREHYETRAMLWERQALLRARAVAGDPRTAAAFESLRREILLRPLPADAAAEIHRVRARMQAELAAETATHRDLKRGRGGLLDVEAIASWLQLRHAHAHGELLDVDRTERVLARLAALGLLDASQARALIDGWEFLERLASRLRVVENRSISDLDAERGDLDGLARRLGYALGAREASARRALLDDYARHTDAIRRVYREVFGAG